MTRTVMVALAWALMVGSVAAQAITPVHPYAGLEVVQNQGNMALYDTSGVRNRFSYRGMDGGVFAGLGAEWIPHLWLGAEISGDFSSARSPTQNITASAGSSIARLRARSTVGASLVPGIWISRVMLFGRAGIVQSRFELRQTPPPSGGTSQTDQTKVGGTLLGGGLQLHLMGRVHLRGEYDRLLYRHFSSFSNRIYLTDTQYRLAILFDLY